MFTSFGSSRELEFLNIWLSRRPVNFTMASPPKKPPKRKPSKRKPLEQTSGERDGGKKRKRGDAIAHLPPSSRPSQSQPKTKKKAKKHRTWTEVEKKMRDGLIQTAAEVCIEARANNPKNKLGEKPTVPHGLYVQNEKEH